MTGTSYIMKCSTVLGSLFTVLLISTNSIWAHAFVGSSARNLVKKATVVDHAGEVYENSGGSWGEAEGWKKITDGDPATSWMVMTNHSSPAYQTFATVDLGATFPLTTMTFKVRWDRNYGNSADIELAVSDDGASWDIVETKTVDQREFAMVNGSGFTARYVRIKWVGSPWNGWGHIYELQAYSLPNVAKGQPIVHHSGDVYEITHGLYGDPDGWTRMVDGDIGRGWVVSSSQNTQATVDLGAVYELRGIGFRVSWDSRCASTATLRIRTSNDNVTWGSSWTRIVEQYEYALFTPVYGVGRYVKIEWLSTNNCWSIIRELEVFADTDLDFMRRVDFVSAGAVHALGLRADGTAIGIGRNYDGETDVADWKNIKQVATGAYFSLGLKMDGTVVAIGNNNSDQLEVNDWTNIVSIATGNHFSLGVKADGTVVVAGSFRGGKPIEVGELTDIVAASGGNSHMLGLRSDGTVACVVSNNDNYGQCDTNGWTNVVQVVANENSSLGLRSDGTVYCVGRNYFDQCGAVNWTDIVQLSGNFSFVVGVKSDGSAVATSDIPYPLSSDITTGIKFEAPAVRATNEVDSWTDVVQATTALAFAIGLRADGTVVTVCNSMHCEGVENWYDIGPW